MKKHLAIMSKPMIDAVLSGKKTVESRFSKHKIAPFQSISSDDLVYMKVPGGDIIGQFRVKKVFSFEGVNEKDVQKIFDDFWEMIKSGDDSIDQAFLKQKRDSHYVTLIFIGNSERLITAPIKIKKSDQRGWVVLS